MKESFWEKGFYWLKKIVVTNLVILFFVCLLILNIWIFLVLKTLWMFLL